MSYFLLQQDVYIPGTLALRGVPEDLDPVDWIQGRKIDGVQAPVQLELSAASGSLKSDIILSFLPVFSGRLNAALAEQGIDNIDYYGCILQHPASGARHEDYWLANVLGRVKCVDMSKSSFTPRPSGRGGTLKEFVVDEKAARGLKLFRLSEQATLIIISDVVKQHLERAGLTGLYLPATERYKGTVGGSLFDRA